VCRAPATSAGGSRWCSRPSSSASPWPRYARCSAVSTALFAHFPFQGRNVSSRSKCSKRENMKSRRRWPNCGEPIRRSMPASSVGPSDRRAASFGVSRRLHSCPRFAAHAAALGTRTMPSYRAPVDDVQFLLNDVFHIDRYANLPGFADASPDVVEAILGEAAKLSEQVLTPLNRVGDKEGCKRQGDGSVTTPAGFKDAFKQIVEGGWIGISAPPEFGG